MKSCRGETLEQAVVEPWGLAGDRRWMLVDEPGEAVTIREHRGMLLIHPRLRADGGLGSATARRDLEDLVVDVPSRAPDLVAVSLFGNTPFLAALADDEAHAWFSKAVGEPVRLVHADDPSRRPANPAYAGPGVPMAFADGYPLHLTTEESLAELNELIAAGPMADQGPLPMVRFRPNLVVAGGAPLGRGRLAAAADRRGGVPRGQGLRPVRDPDHRREHGRAVQGADRTRWPGSGAGTARSGSG